MRDAFPEYFVGDPERQQKLWAECIFVLDTNVLLDLYRFSDSAREALFKVMGSLGERLWIPYQVAAEYFENRLSVIEAQSKAYAESINGLKVEKEKFNSGSRHPFVSDEVFNNFLTSYDLMIKELDEKQDIYLSYIGNDVIKAKIGDLLHGRVGSPYSEQQLIEVAAEGEKRYLDGVPPGFKDGGKMPEATTAKLRLKKFGDLIVWKQVIEKAAAEGKSVILVTGEKKEDWWLKTSSKNLVSALPALTKEFVDAVKQDFYLYATDRFLLKANEYLEQNTSDVVVEEVRAINKEDAARADKLDSLNLPEHLSLPHMFENNKWVSGLVPPRGTWSSETARYAATQKVARMAKEFVARRSALQQQVHSLGEQLESLLLERDQITSFQSNYYSTGGSTADEIFVQSEDELARVEAAIRACEIELTTNRSLLRTMSPQLGLHPSRDDD